MSVSRIIRAMVAGGLAALLLQAGAAPAQEIDIDLHIIGFEVNDGVRAQLEEAANAGGGRYYQSADEMQLTQALGEATGLAPAADPAPGDRPAVTVVLDASNSMWGQVSGRAKIEIAREAIGTMLQGWNPDADIGLVAYGHRRVGDCSDIETILPEGRLDATAFMAAVDRLVPTGKTPLTAAVRQAAENLSYQDRPATVILFSDGIETCNADPCALARDLEQGGVAFTVHVVGFDVSANEPGLACLAQQTGGLFLAASNPAELQQALTTIADVSGAPAQQDMVTLEAVDPTTRATIGQGVIWTLVGLDTEDRVPITAGIARPVLRLPPGAYSAEAAVGAASGRTTFTVVAGEGQTVQVVLGQAPLLPGVTALCGEPNNSFGTAPDVPLDQPLGGQIDPVGDADMCAITVPGAGVLSVAATAAPAGLELVYRVLGPDGNVVRDWSAALTAGGQAEVADLPEGGRFVLDIRDSYSDAGSADPYALSLSFAQAVDDTEPNESFARAQPIVPGESLRLAIFPRGEHNFLQIMAPQPGLLEVTASGVPASLDIALRVLDADRGVVRDWVVPAGPGQDTALRAELPLAGRYVLEVADSYDDAREPAPLTLTTRYTPSPDPFEPNGRPSEAAPLAFDAPVQAAILPRGDQDFYALDVQHRGALQVTVSGVPAGLDVALRVLDAEMNVVRDWVVPAGPGQDTILRTDLPEPGRYSLHVSDNYSDASDVMPYTLVATFAAAEDGNEPDDRISRARPLALGQPASISLLPRSDNDYFVIEAPAGSLTIAATGVPAGLDVALRLLNQEFAVVRDWVVPSAPGQDTRLTADLAEPGRYYVQVSDSYNDASAPQSFTVTATMP